MSRFHVCAAMLSLTIMLTVETALADQTKEKCTAYQLTRDHETVHSFVGNKPISMEDMDRQLLRDIEKCIASGKSQQACGARCIERREGQVLRLVR